VKGIVDVARVDDLDLRARSMLPIAMGLVLEFAAGRPTGAYYALVASAGGLAVVVGNAALAPLYQLAYAPSITALAPWLLLSVLGAVAAMFVRRFIPQHPAAASVRKDRQKA
jgi:hypothetical protein